MPAGTNESNGLNVIASGFVRIPKGGDKDSERSRINDQIQLGSGDSHQRGSISASSIMQEPEHMRALTHTHALTYTQTRHAFEKEEVKLDQWSKLQQL